MFYIKELEDFVNTLEAGDYTITYEVSYLTTLKTTADKTITIE